FIVKVIKMIIFFIISIILVFLVGFLVRGIHLTFIQWLMSGLLLLIGAIVFLSLGTILTNFKDEKTASVFSDILFLALAMLGGLWFPTRHHDVVPHQQSRARPMATPITEFTTAAVEECPGTHEYRATHLF
ncbi:hypothetical protein P3G66_31910, partial [Rhodococcus sp. C3V]